MQHKKAVECKEVVRWASNWETTTKLKHKQTDIIKKGIFNETWGLREKYWFPPTAAGSDWCLQ